MAKILEFSAVGARAATGARGAAADAANLLRAAAGAAPRFADIMTVQSVKQAARGARAVSEASAAAASRAVVNLREAMPHVGSAAADAVGTTAAAGSSALRTIATRFRATTAWLATKSASPYSFAQFVLTSVAVHLRCAPRPVKIFLIGVTAGLIALGLTQAISWMRSPSVVQAEQTSLPANIIGSRISLVPPGADQAPVEQASQADTSQIVPAAPKPVHVEHVDAPAKASGGKTTTGKNVGTPADKKPAAKKSVADDSAPKKGNDQTSASKKAANDKSSAQKSTGKQAAAQAPKTVTTDPPIQQIDITAPQ